MTTVKFYTFNYVEKRTYWATLLFVLGNIALPQLFHLIPNGGKIWLPIYFFTLIGAYKYGWKVGLLTAIMSPVANSILFGMPLPEVLPVILLKSILLAIIAGYMSYKYNKVTLGLLLCVVLLYQCLGTLGEWIITGNIYLAMQDFRIGILGMILQLFGGYAFIRYIIYK
ncbi:MAG: ECF transporter S component [Prevotella sp.]